MNFQLWFETLRSSINQWQHLNKSVYVGSMQFEPIAPAESIEPAQRELALKLPQDLADFYSKATGACDIQFSVELPEHLTLASDRISVSQIGAGFGLLPLSTLPDVRRRWCELLEDLPNDDPEKLQMFMRFGIPIWVDRGSNFIVYVVDEAGSEAGIYFMDYGSLPETKSHVKCTGSLTEWLQFLEQSCYVELSLDSVRLWHDGHRLVPNELFRQQILEAIRLDMPQCAERRWEDSLPDTPLGDRFRQLAKENPQRVGEVLETYLGRIKKLVFD